MNPDQIVAIATGTAGLTAFLIYAVRLLWVSHEKQDTDVRAQRDVLLVDNRAQTAANARLADAMEKSVTGYATLAAGVEKLVTSNATLAATVEQLSRRTKP